MYRIAETGHTVSITKEKFLNTYPPLFNTLFADLIEAAGGVFFVYSREDVDCRKRPREAQECAKVHSYLQGKP